MSCRPLASSVVQYSHFPNFAFRQRTRQKRLREFWVFDNDEEKRISFFAVSSYPSFAKATKTRARNDEPMPLHYARARAEFFLWYNKLPQILYFEEPCFFSSANNENDALLMSSRQRCMISLCKTLWQRFLTCKKIRHQLKKMPFIQGAKSTRTYDILSRGCS